MPEQPGRPSALSLRSSGNRWIAALLALGVVLLLAAIGAAYLAVGQVTRDGEWVEHTLRVQASINRMSALNEQIENGRRGFLIASDSDFQRVVRDASGQFVTEQEAGRKLTLDNARQQAAYIQVAALHQERAKLIDATFLNPASAIATARSGNFERDRTVVLSRRIRAIAGMMYAEEARLLTLRTRQQFGSLLQFYFVGGAAVLLLLSVLGTVIFLILRYNADLTRAQGQLRRANEGLETAVATRTAELLRANQEIQRFAYIVSHDLRSPLVNVLGFTAELDEARKTVRKYLTDLFEKDPSLRDEPTWLAVEEDLPEALGFIRTSTEKMDRLINSILQLSRQGRRQLNPEKLDMEALADGVVATLHQRAQDAGAQVTVNRPIPPIESDRISVEQILANLVENAIKYLCPTRPGEIAISGSEALGVVRIDVTDNGRGVDPRDHERIFELFRRSGAQDQPGEGIGLANVRALAYRLGGVIEVESQLDQGARFRLSLPAKFVAMETAA